MLDHLECGDKIESSIRKRQRVAAALHKMNPRPGKRSRRVGHGFRGYIYAGHAQGTPEFSLSELLGSVAGSAPGIEHCCAWPHLRGELRGEPVSRQMLVEQIGIHQPWDYALSGKFNVSQPGPPEARSARLCRAAGYNRKPAHRRGPSAR